MVLSILLRENWAVFWHVVKLLPLDVSITLFVMFNKRGAFRLGVFNQPSLAFYFVS